MNEPSMRLSATPRKEPIIIGQPAVAIKEIKSRSMPVCLGVLAPDTEQSSRREVLTADESNSDRSSSE